MKKLLWVFLIILLPAYLVADQQKPLDEAKTSFVTPSLTPSSALIEQYYSQNSKKNYEELKKREKVFDQAKVKKNSKDDSMTSDERYCMALGGSTGVVNQPTPRSGSRPYIDRELLARTSPDTINYHNHNCDTILNKR